MTTRHQATLFVPAEDSAGIESLRARFNPVQHGLIRAHVTLCREDEVRDWDELALRLRDLAAIEVAMEFGAPVREEQLVYVPAVRGTEAFDALRFALLGSEGVPPRKHKAHITLVHPRNATCSDAQFAELSRLYQPVSTVFRAVTLIAQVDGGRWA